MKNFFKSQASAVLSVDFSGLGVDPGILVSFHKGNKSPQHLSSSQEHLCSCLMRAMGLL